MKLCTHCNKIIERRVHPSTKNPFCDKGCYGEWQKGKDFSSQGKGSREKRHCSIDGCENIHFGKGYCCKHYTTEANSKNYTIPKAPTKRRVLVRHCDNCGVNYETMRDSSKYCSSSCSGESRRKRYIVKKGYIKVLAPDHHRADSKGYVFEHILVMEKKIGRPIILPEVVHHLDHNKKNNSEDNLVLCPTQQYHIERYHSAT